MSLVSPTRRAVLTRAAFVGAVAAPWVKPARANFDYDVAVIGAGAAGLAAGRELEARGKRFVILEARERIGGRLHTDESLGAPFDAGGLFIHWAERNPWREMAAKLGVATIEEPRGELRLFENGAPISESERRKRRGGFGRLDRYLEADDMPDVSVAERVAPGGAELLQAAGGAMRMSLGEEPERVSALDYARLWSGDDLIVPLGYGTLARRYGDGLPIKLGAAVTAIRWGGPGVEIDTAAGTVRAERAIVTVPVGVLKAGAIAFAPALPAETLAALDGLAMGALAKIALRFNGARFGLTPHTDLFNIVGPRALFDFDCWSHDRDLIVAYCGGDHAREVIGQGEAGSVETALAALEAVVGREARKAFVKGKTVGWVDDPFALGAYSHALPGQAEARAALARPVGARLWFAGEATGGTAPDFGGAMTAGGAFLAGKTAAQAASAA
jgi:monoamine oxidase